MPQPTILGIKLGTGSAGQLAGHDDAQFRALRSNMLWLSDFTFVAARQGSVYVGFLLDTVERALHYGRPVGRNGLVHHSQLGGVQPSVHIPTEPAVLRASASSDPYVTLMPEFTTERMPGRGVAQPPAPPCA